MDDAVRFLGHSLSDLAPRYDDIASEYGPTYCSREPDAFVIRVSWDLCRIDRGRGQLRYDRGND